MAFLQKNVNVFLMILVLFVAGALAGSSAYYQNTFKDINTRYEDTAKDLSSCKADVQIFSENLEKTVESLNTTSEDIRKYDELYTEKSSELSVTQNILTDTNTKLKTAQLDFAEASALKDKYKRDYESQLSVNADIREQNSLLSAQKAQLQSEVISLSSRLSAANKCINNFVDDYTGILDAAVISSANSCKK